MKKTLFAALLSCTFAAASAAPPTDASLEKLMQVQHIDKMWKDMSATMPDIAKQVMAQDGGMQAILQRLPESQKQQFVVLTEKLLDDIAAEAASPAFRDRIKQLVIQEMKNTYTQEEVDAMTAFFSTPVGQSVIKKQSAFSAKILPAVSLETQEAIAPHTRAYIDAVARLARSGKKTGKAAKVK
ncbi:Uncharacterized protein conserved in bacteria [Kingella potus]|uniref:Uncharacterized protein conserved in bacteria n=1 Tax=Kingella potus TaxID=265175 RepID=A0A377QXM4_9NEIS|nr:DUF2059 domain-containing protein [Kingella potus]UOP01736.1 DUF2059 domain-containing protein [Kingella potus]STQ99953.1 Uncharacterized protein conserved in bacteria [Kingella potus]